MAEDSEVFNSVLDWLIATQRNDQSEKWREFMNEEDIQSNPSVQLREDITEARLSVTDFDHDDPDGCKRLVASFLYTYRSYCSWLKSPSGHPTADGHYWFKHFRKLVKQTAFSLLLKNMNMTIDSLPDESDLADFSENNPASQTFKFKTYEAEVSSFYSNCMKNWGQGDEEVEDHDEEDESFKEECAKELKKDLGVMLDIRKESRAVSWPKVFLRIDDNRGELLPAPAQGASQESSGAEDPRRFIRNVVSFLQETEDSSLGKPSLAEASSKSGVKNAPKAAAAVQSKRQDKDKGKGAHSSVKIERKAPSSSSSSSSSSTPAAAAARVSTNEAIREAAKMRAEAATRKPSLPPKGSKPSGKSISGPRKSAHTIPSIEDDDDDSGAMDMQAPDEGSDDDDDDDDDEAGGAKRAVAKAKAATMSADKSRIAIKRKFKATLRANAGDEEGSGSDGGGDGGDEGKDPSYDPFEEEKEEEEDVKGVVIVRKVKRDGSPDKRVKSDEDLKTRRRNMRPGDLEGREVTEPLSPLGKPTRKRVNWTFDEEQSLIEGIKVHRTEFARILEDPRFGVMLSRRTNVDLKDKYRTMRKRGTVKDMGDRPEGWRKEMGRAYAGSKKAKKRGGDEEEEEEE